MLSQLCLDSCLTRGDKPPPKLAELDGKRAAKTAERELRLLKLISSRVVEGRNNKAKVKMR